jgi:predicted nucleic acid-binding protein
LCLAARKLVVRALRPLPRLILEVYLMVTPPEDFIEHFAVGRSLGALTSRHLVDLLNFVACGPVVQEVLQGLRQGPASEAFRDAFLALPVLSEPLPCASFLAAAEIYRLGRAKGHTIRSSTDCLIAAIAIDHRVPVWHKDRDFEAIAVYTSLRTRRFDKQRGLRSTSGS